MGFGSETGNPKHEKGDETTRDVFRIRRRNPLTFRAAEHKRIAHELRRTTADGVVIDDLTPRLYATGARTRIAAFLVDASLILGALSGDDALGSACGRAADEIGLARTDCVAATYATYAVRSAGGRLARITGGFRCNVQKT